MKFRSIRARTFILILPLLIITLISLGAISYINAKTMINQQLDQKMNQQLLALNYEIESNLTGHARIAQSFARTLESEENDFYSLEQLHTLLRNQLKTNQDTFGLGVFYVPYKYKSDLEFFSTYAYHDNGIIQTTETYNDPSYNYPSQDWYKIALSGDKPFYMTNPYYDNVTKVLMSTATVPFYNTSNELQGMITGDINLKTIQTFINETKVGKNGWAMLLDSNGQYMANKNGSITESITQDSNASLRKIAPEIMKNEIGQTEFQDNRGTNRIYYKKLPMTDWVIALAIPEKELTAPLQKLLNLIIIVGTFSIIIITLIILFYSRYIVRQVDNVNVLSERMAHGDFSEDMVIKTEDEFKKMGSQLNTMLSNVRDLLAKINFDTTQLSSTSEQLKASANHTMKVTENVAAAMQQVASGSKEQVSSIEESTQALNEMSLGMQTISTSCSNVAESTSNVSLQAKQGNDSIQYSIIKMHDVEETVKNTSAGLERLAEHSKKIGLITEVITGITEQTNLLALNAAIEAARAGEQGRGFAVVASEVRNLAEQSKKSAAQITQLINEVQLDTTQVVEVMNKGSVNVKEGVKAIQDAGNIFGNIVNEINNVNTQIHELSAASEELTASTEEVSASSQNLLWIATESLSNTTEVASSSNQQLQAMEEIITVAKSLSKLASELEEMVAQFKY